MRPPGLRLLAALSVCWGLWVPSRPAARADDPFAPPPADGSPEKKPSGPIWGSPDRPADWGNGELRVPLDYRTGVTFGPSGCPVLVVGRDVWDLKANKVAAQIKGTYEPRGLRALSATGRWFAAASRSPNQTDTTVTVWSTADGERVLEVFGEPDVFVDLLTITRDKYLLVGGRHGPRIDVWDIAAGKKVTSLTVPDRRVDREKVVFTPDGRYFAAATTDKIVVHETQGGRAVAVLEHPPGERSGFIYPWLRGLSFSPDGTELTALIGSSTGRLVCWDSSGKLVFDQQLSFRPWPNGPAVSWKPDRSGWLIDGRFLDRATKQVLFEVKVPFGSEVRPTFLDEERVAGVIGEDRSTLRAVPIPWDRIEASRKRMTDAKAAALLSPAKPTSIAFDFEGLKGKGKGDDPHGRAIREALRKRLTDGGLTVAEDAPARWKLRVTEEVVRKPAPFLRPGEKKPRQLMGVKGTAHLTLLGEDGESVAWERELTAGVSELSFPPDAKGIDEEALRRMTFAEIVSKLQALDVPYFLPADPDESLALPAVIE